MTSTAADLPYYKRIRAQFETGASAYEQAFVAEVANINDVLADAVKEMIVLGLDVAGVKAKFAAVMKTGEGSRR